MTPYGNNGQSSIELISYTGLFILASAAALTYLYPEWETANRVSTAEATVRDIKTTVDNVYSSGPGRRETITINVPTGVIRTQAAEGRINMVLEIPGGGATEVLEVTNAPVKGNIPKTDGIHKLTIEYTRSGWIVLGSGLYMEPSLVELNTTSGNTTNFTVTVGNAGNSDLSGVKMNVTGPTATWFSMNDTSFNLNRGASKTILVTVTVPTAVMPVLYTNYLTAENTEAYVESTISLDVQGRVCGDTVKQPPEECETRTPFTFPDQNNPYCPNPGWGIGGVNCSASTHQYQAYDAYGDCTGDCTCTTDSPAWITCGTGCTDPQYCNNCAHCFDAVKNCGETMVDGGGACPICDGVDDLAEGFPCSLGQTAPCGISDCLGTKTCIPDGIRCQWSACTTYGVKCPTTKCCSCVGAPENPAPTLNVTFKTDCSPLADQFICGNPDRCEGGLYRGECSATTPFTCVPDLDQSSWNMTANISACFGQTCRPQNSSCWDNTYPCHGATTTYMCSASGTCEGATAENIFACSSEPNCAPPQTIILHKLDGGYIYDYVDHPSSWPFAPGWEGDPWWKCDELRFSYTVLTGMYHTEPGAYAPYQNGTLRFYGKAWHLSNTVYQGNCHWTYCVGKEGDDKTSFIRIGTDSNNYNEYKAPTPTPQWTRMSVNLKTPTRTVGTVDWNRIGYLDFSYIVGRECQPSDTGCGSCQGWLDYVTLEK